MMITVQVQDKGKTSFYIFSSFKITIFFLGITDQITDIRILDGTTKITSQEGINVTMIMNQEGTNVIINKLIVMILKIPEIFQDLVDRTDTKATEMMTSLMIDFFYVIHNLRPPHIHDKIHALSKTKIMFVFVRPKRMIM